MSARLLLGISVLWVPLAFLFDGVTVLMLPIRLGADPTAIGVVSLTGLAVAAGLQPVAGWVSDRYRGTIDRRLFLMGAAVPAVGGLWVLAGTAGIAGAVVGYVVLQAAATTLQAGQQTLIPEHVTGAARGRAAGLKTAFDVGGAFLAFLVLGILLAAAGVATAALVMTALLAGAVALVVTLVPPAASERTAARWSFAIPPGLAALVFARFLFLVGAYGVGRFLVLLVGERLGVPPERAVAEAGSLLALFTLTTAIGAIPLGWLADRRRRRDLMVGGALLTAVGILALVPPAGLPGLLLGGLVMSLGTAAFVTANWAATTDLVPPQEAGRLMGIANLGTGLAAAAAGILGPLIAVGGFAPALLVAGAASAGAVLPLLIPGTHHHPAPENAT